MKRADKILPFVIGGIFIIGIILVGGPVYNDLDVKTITKIDYIYENPISITFHWITADQIQVGKLITLELEIQDLPYEQNMTLSDIIVNFDQTQLNYWIDEKAASKIFDNEAKRQISYPMKDEIILKLDLDSNTFKSESFNLRFVTPEDVSIQYCDYNLDSPCYQINNIIHPAPYDIDDRIQGNRIVISMSLVTVGLSSIVVWTTLRKNKN